MEVVHKLILERNNLETAPFREVYNSNAQLTELVRKLRGKCQTLETECHHQQKDLKKLMQEVSNKGPSKGELKLKAKVESLKNQITEHEKKEEKLKEQSAKVSDELAQHIQLAEKKEKTIQTLLEELKQKDVVIEKITVELRESNAKTEAAEQQYEGLKKTIVRLQEENDTLVKSNDELVKRIVQEKEKYMEEMSKLMDMNEKANKKIAMLQQLQEQEKKRFTWRNKKNPTETSTDSNATQSDGRKFGSVGVVLPSGLKQSISAHRSQAICVRYDSAGGDVVATASEDSTVKIWSTGNGNLLKTLRGGSGQVMLGLDICSELAAGCGTDKTCRIWNTRTQRLVHQLVGHSQKITAVRFLKGNAQAVLTASADRSMKVWDISRHTYRQSVTMRHSSSSNCLDVSYDSVTAVTGHLDGGVRFFDIRSSERTAEVTELHSGGVTSVNFNPNNNAEILTTGRDNTLKLVDVRKSGQELQTYFHKDFRIDLSYAACAISPDGKYGAAGSSTGDIFIWRLLDGVLEKQLKGHEAGVVAVAWDRGGSNGQQFSSVDKKGNLCLWA